MVVAFQLVFGECIVVFNACIVLYVITNFAHRRMCMGLYMESQVAKRNKTVQLLSFSFSSSL